MAQQLFTHSAPQPEMPKLEPEKRSLGSAPSRLWQQTAPYAWTHQVRLADRVRVLGG